jgi:hypothetical protein
VRLGQLVADVDEGDHIAPHVPRRQNGAVTNMLRRARTRLARFGVGSGSGSGTSLSRRIAAFALLISSGVAGHLRKLAGWSRRTSSVSLAR